ncbi:alpha/beta hydrolase [Kitasatospora sp. DSM 101779]|uniref:alpha/beta hydrolase n=1 Tax=Kitasatospora sp. DSM 101779 TaxID=2853165 RepID=UPI0021D96974|nr:alpha/beta hydrolase [Kitasatospora sp. DSM 101779]MCU7827024.1 alpha/beta hydrolase [Kitasatospora sp. DSM 101779]
MRIVHTAAAAALLALLGTNAPASAASRSAEPPAAQSAGAASLTGPLNWGPCADTAADSRQQCATLAVPLDHADPNGPQLGLAVSRIASARPELRRGSLLIVPGGPGNPGLNGPTSAVRRLPQSVLDRYDLVGFDPRGVGRSSPVDCRLAHEDLSMTTLLPFPAPDGSLTGNLAAARRIADTCTRNGGPVLRSISTRNEARDMDRIRQALGERRISAWGVSYGTYAGAVYATMFPDRTDRIVLDSNDDPDPRRVERGWLAAYATGAEDRFPDFAAWASDPATPDHRLAGTPQQVRELFLRLAARLDTAPLPWPGANPARLDGNALRAAMLDALYDDARFPRLARLMLAADGRAELPPAATPPDAAMQNTVAVSVATLCNDVRWPRSAGSYARAVAADRLAHPLTAGMPVNVMPCAFWSGEPAEPPTEVTPDGPSNILMVQNLRDPATPYAGALRLRAALGGRAELVSVDSGGHDAYVAHGNSCGDRLVTRFLVDGRRPERDTLCPAER